MNSYNLLSNTSYIDLTYKLIRVVESERPLVYIDSVGKATIGTGFLLWSKTRNTTTSTSVQDAVFKKLGFHDSSSDPGASNEVKIIEDEYRRELQEIFDINWKIGTDSKGWNPVFLAEVDEVMTRRYNDARLTFSKRSVFEFGADVDTGGDNVEMKSVFNVVRADYEQRVADALNNRVAIPPSKELAALFSLAYVGLQVDAARSISNASLETASRAEIWYAIRYGALSNYKSRKLAGTPDDQQAYETNKNGYAKRMLLSAQVFGLYDKSTDVPPEEAKQIFVTLTRHRKEILAFEAQFGVPPDGTGAVRNTVGEANRDPQYSSIVSIQEFKDAFAPALSSYVAWVNRELLTDVLPISESDWNAAAIFYNGITTDGTDGYVDPTLDARVLDDMVGGLENNLLVGAAGVNSLYGGKGDDVLIGRGEKDWLDGGAGNDLLLGGADDDSLLGGAGADTYVFRAGDGKDTIEDDSAGQGRIVLGGQALEGAEEKDYRLVDNLSQWSVEGGKYIYAG